MFGPYRFYIESRYECWLNSPEGKEEMRRQALVDASQREHGVKVKATDRLHESKMAKEALLSQFKLRPLSLF